ncbi:MAG: FGGY-family carbohydrate kinase [Cyanophyceae cyanobacterium]
MERTDAPLSLGIDFGTSGVRAIAVEPTTGAIAGMARLSFDGGDRGTSLAAAWRSLLFEAIAALDLDVRRAVGAIAIDGTSGTLLLCDRDGTPLDEPILYNDDRGGEFLDQIRAIAPATSPAASTSSAFARSWWWRQTRFGGAWPSPTGGLQLLHQADWLAAILHGQPRRSDYHNALKLGYDPVALAYPDWLLNLDLASALPQVMAPGDEIGPILPEIARSLDLPLACRIKAGTTDSIAAFLASGCDRPGQAVTSLGSSLALKLLSRRPLQDQATGVYSHRFGPDLWLAGGASNTGGAVLRHLFPGNDLMELTAQLTAQFLKPSPVVPLPGPIAPYYPLLKPGERFPVNDPHLPPRLEPHPRDRAAFLYGVLAAIARIEAEGYGKLMALGGDPLTEVRSAGGGAHNPIQTALRAQRLGVPVTRSPQTEAAYGTARLAAHGLGPAKGPAEP